MAVFGFKLWPLGRTFTELTIGVWTTLFGVLFILLTGVDALVFDAVVASDSTLEEFFSCELSTAELFDKFSLVNWLNFNAGTSLLTLL